MPRRKKKTQEEECEQGELEKRMNEENPKDKAEKYN